MLAELRNDEDVQEAAATLVKVCETRRRRVEAVNLRFGGKQGYKCDWYELVG